MLCGYQRGALEPVSVGESFFRHNFRPDDTILDESVLQTIAETLPLTEGTEKLISTLKRYGFTTAILSGGFNFFGNFHIFGQ